MIVRCPLILSNFLYFFKIPSFTLKFQHLVLTYLIIVVLWLIHNYLSILQINFVNWYFLLRVFPILLSFFISSHQFIPVDFKFLKLIPTITPPDIIFPLKLLRITIYIPIYFFNLFFRFLYSHFITTQ